MSTQNQVHFIELLFSSILQIKAIPADKCRKRPQKWWLGLYPTRPRLFYELVKLVQLASFPQPNGLLDSQVHERLQTKVVRFAIIGRLRITSDPQINVGLPINAHFGLSACSLAPQ